MLLLRLLLVLLLAVRANRAGQPIPQFMVGDVPAKGKPYQIVRIIEYVVPQPYKPPAGSLEHTAGADSLEIIAPHLERQLKRKRSPKKRTLLHNSNRDIPATATAKPTVATNFLVKIYPMSGVGCTGALISYRLVLTTSQCFAASQSQSPVPQHYMVQVTGSGMYNVDTILAGSSSNLDEDLALLVLGTFIEEIEAQPVALCDVPPRRGDSVIMYMSQRLPSFLRTQIVSNRVCKKTFATLDTAYITESMFCGHNSNKRGDCQTIRGDPLVYRERLCGINIYGSRCQDGAINGDLYANVYRAKQQLEAMIERYS